VPPRTLERKTDGVTPYSKQYRDPFPRKQSRQERTTPLLGCVNPQSGKVEQDDGRLNLESYKSELEDVPVPEFRFLSGLKWTTLLPPTKIPAWHEVDTAHDQA